MRDYVYICIYLLDFCDVLSYTYCISPFYQIPTFCDHRKVSRQEHSSIQMLYKDAVCLRLCPIREASE